MPHQLIYRARGPWRRALAPLQRRAASLTPRHARAMAQVAAEQQVVTIGVTAATPAELDAALTSLGQVETVAASAAAAALLAAGNSQPPEQQPAYQFVPVLAPSSEPDPAHGTFRMAPYFAALRTRCLGRVLLAAARAPSTQSLVQAHGAVLPDGLVFVADRQDGGRGRGGNTWESPAGCLMFTAAARAALPGQVVPFVQYLVSLAVLQAIQAEAAARLQGATLGVRIKWPNDLYAGPLKLGGVLCHSSYRGGAFHLVMGVGLNVSNARPTTCVDSLVAEAAAKAGLAPPPPVGREELLAGALSRLEPMLQRLETEGFGPYEADYYAAWLHSGQRVELEEGGSRVGLTIAGLSPQGYLMGLDAAGQAYELHPDGNSLDFFAGLVRKKLPS